MSQIIVDEEIRRLDQSGDLKNVIGSQSLLSQELFASQTPSQTSMMNSLPSESVFSRSNSINALYNSNAQPSRSEVSAGVRIGLHKFASADTQNRRPQVFSLSQVSIEETTSMSQESSRISESQDSFLANLYASGATKGRELEAIIDAAQIVNERDKERSEFAADAVSSSITEQQDENDRDNMSSSSPLFCRESICDAGRSIFNRQTPKMSNESSGMKLFETIDYTKVERLDTNSCKRVLLSQRKGKPGDKNKMDISATKTEHDAFSISKVRSADLKETPSKVRKGYNERNKKSRIVIEKEAFQAAGRASMLIQNDKNLYKSLLLSMAMSRENPRTKLETPDKGKIIGEGFFWANFPPLEELLKGYMSEYYELSTQKCHSRQQQDFNNMLVMKVREEAAKKDWTFEPKCFNDRKIRDRIRCFFKTHIQNAKKRLNTMIKDPSKRANMRALQAHFELIFGISSATR